MNINRLREWLSRIFLLIFSLFISIVLLEFAVRIFMPQSDRFVEYDPVLGWKHPANREGYWRQETTHPVRIRTNSHSLRGPEIDFHKKANQFRLLMLGDSYTEAFQVDEAASHTARLEQLLHSGFPGLDFQVINTGVGGYGTGQELLYFQTQGKKYMPDLVVLNVCTNDFSDDADRYSGIRPIFHAVNDSLQLALPEPKSFWMLKFRDRFLMNMHLASLVRDRINMLAPAAGELFHQWGLGRTGGKSRNLNDRRTVLLINTLQSEVKAIHAELIVLMIPPGGLVHQLNLAKPFVEERSGAYLLGELAEKLRANNIDVIEPLDLFKDRAAAGKTLYVNYNGHWTSAGHELAAQILYSYIRRAFETQLRNFLSLNIEREAL
jgi:hypothetical protein